MFFFLDKAVSSFGYDVPENAGIYCTAESGLKLVQEDKVLGFLQGWNPGPYVAQIPDVDEFAPTSKEYAFLIGMSVRKTNALAERFKKEPSAKNDATWLVHLLTERRTDPDSDIRSRDHIAELACARVANLHDPDAIRYFLRFHLPSYCARILRLGLASPAGRDFVLERIGDPQEPKETRLRYAQTLEALGSIYHSTSTEITAESSRPTGSAVKGNAAFLTRIAELAGANSKDEELCLAIVKGLKSCTDSSTPGNAELQPDLVGAAAALDHLYQSASEKVKFQIEDTLAWVFPIGYQDLKSTGGPVASILSPDNAETTLERKSRHLPYKWSITTMESNKVDKVFVVLTNRDNGHKVRIPQNIPFDFGRTGNGGGTGAAELPLDLPKGKYRIALEFDQQDRVISMGHFFDVDL